MTRVYAAHRVEAGVYVQPANDGEQIYVIASYQDGQLHGLESGPMLATFWAWGRLDPGEAKRIEQLAEWDPETALSDLRYVATGNNTHYKTKREAVEAALEGEL